MRTLAARYRGCRTWRHTVAQLTSLSNIYKKEATPVTFIISPGAMSTVFWTRNRTKQYNIIPNGHVNILGTNKTDKISIDRMYNLHTGERDLDLDVSLVRMIQPGPNLSSLITSLFIFRALREVKWKHLLRAQIITNWSPTAPSPPTHHTANNKHKTQERFYRYYS